MGGDRPGTLTSGIIGGPIAEGGMYVYMLYTICLGNAGLRGLISEEGKPNVERMCTIYA